LVKSAKAKLERGQWLHCEGYSNDRAAYPFPFGYDFGRSLNYYGYASDADFLSDGGFE